MSDRCQRGAHLQQDGKPLSWLQQPQNDGHLKQRQILESCIGSEREGGTPAVLVGLVHAMIDWGLLQREALTDA